MTEAKQGGFNRAATRVPPFVFVGPRVLVRVPRCSVTTAFFDPYSAKAEDKGNSSALILGLAPAVDSAADHENANVRQAPEKAGDSF